MEVFSAGIKVSRYDNKIVNSIGAKLNVNSESLQRSYLLILFTCRLNKRFPTACFFAFFVNLLCVSL